MTPEEHGPPLWARVAMIVAMSVVLWAAGVVLGALLLARISG